MTDQFSGRGTPDRSLDAEGEDALRRVETALAGRWPESRLEPSLDRIRALTALMDDPQGSFAGIHVTGTNGKTSTARMVDVLLRTLNLRTGRYTSPHVESVVERICVDGDPLSAQHFADVYDEVAPYCALVDAGQPVPLSYFEVLTGMAYAAFADAPVDVAVVEVGMGGAWDATNVMDGQVAVVTPIALDHADYLGEDVAAVAGEKSGIIKPGAFVVMAQQPVDAAAEMLRRSAEVEATVAREGFEFGVVSREVAVDGQLVSLRGLTREYPDVFLPLHGAHQAHNAAVALATVEAFAGRAQTELDLELVRQAFAGVASPGRLEVVRTSPTILLDAAHNPASAQALADAVSESFAFSRLVGVVGVLADKDARTLLEALEPVLAEVVATQSTSARALPAEELGELAEEIFGADRVTVVPRMDDALDAGVAAAESEGELTGAGVLVTGSITTVGDARRLLGRG
ncbi:MAG: bifunctional folylpolyglutamate synthase/dihydrofolate synthase [Actinomycetes bacterium]